MDHSLVSFTGRTWFICVNTWNDQNFVLDLFLHFAQTKKIITYSIFVIGRTWSDDCEEFIGFAGERRRGSPASRFSLSA